MEAFPLSCPFQLYAKLGAEPGTKCSGKTALSTPHNFFITPLVLLGSRCMGCAGSSTWEGPVTGRYEDPTLTLPTQPVCYGFGGAHSHPDLPQGVKPHCPTVQLTLSLPPPCLPFTCMSHTGTKCSPASGPVHLLLCLPRMLPPPILDY